jgi:hypothetical protein
MQYTQGGDGDRRAEHARGLKRTVQVSEVTTAEEHIARVISCRRCHRIAIGQ